MKDARDMDVEQEPTEHLVLCHRCHAVNPVHAIFCFSCGIRLSPPRGVVTQLLVTAFGAMRLKLSP